MRRAAALFVTFALCVSCAQALTLPFVKKKQPPEPKEKMVETVAEWSEKAKNVPVEKRKVPIYATPPNPALTVVEDPLRLLKSYNTPTGTQEPNLSNIKKSLMTRSVGVASPDFKKLVYAQYYYAPNVNQISSEVLVIPLNTKETRINRIVKANVLKSRREDHPESGTEAFIRNLYNAFVVVDWSSDSKSVLLKEKIGSANGGRYISYIWVMNFEKNDTMTYQKYDNVQEVIKTYWRKKGIELDNHRWDILPLGWDTNDQNRAILLAYAFQKDNSKIFLGAWSVERYSGITKLLSTTQKEFNIRPNGVVVDFEIK